MSQLQARARKLLDGVRADRAGARAIGRLSSYDGLMLEATGFTRPIGAGARIVSGDNQISLARKTVWTEQAPEVFTGLGQRILTTDGGDHPLMDVRTILIGIDVSDSPGEAVDA